MWAAAVLWPAVVYPLSAGPACYALGRGWIGEDAVGVFYRPAVAVMELTPLDGPWVRLNTWAMSRGRLAVERVPPETDRSAFSNTAS
jgi:hypothetical protein